MTGDHLERVKAFLDLRREVGQSGVIAATAALGMRREKLTDDDLRALVAEAEKLWTERSERDELERALIEIDAKNRRLLDRALKAEAEVERTHADNTALLDGNQRLQTMNDGLRQMAIEAREAANGWHQATIDLYSGREEPQQPERRVVRCGAACSEMHTYVLGWCEAAVPPELRTDDARPTPEPEPTTRRGALLAAIQREGGDWSPLRARASLMGAGYDVASNLAAQEMKTLAEHGFLEPVRPRAFTYRLKAEALQQPERDNFVDLATRTHLNYVPGDEQREQDSAVSGGDGGAWGREPEGGADADGAR